VLVPLTTLQLMIHMISRQALQQGINHQCLIKHLRSWAHRIQPCSIWRVPRTLQVQGLLRIMCEDSRQIQLSQCNDSTKHHHREELHYHPTRWWQKLLVATNSNKFSNHLVTISMANSITMRILILLSHCLLMAIQHSRNSLIVYHSSHKFNLCDRLKHCSSYLCKYPLLSNSNSTARYSRKTLHPICQRLLVSNSNRILHSNSSLELLQL